jgi:hypothetical protein
LEIKPAVHSITGTMLFEVWIEAKMVAVIYPTINRMRLFSRHVFTSSKLPKDGDIEGWEWTFNV